MKIKIDKKNNNSILIFNGEFSVFFIDEIEKAIFNEIEKTGGKIILDLTEVNYLDSSGISLIVNAAQKSKKKLPIVGCQPNVKYVLELAEIDNIVNFYENIEEAINNSN